MSYSHSLKFWFFVNLLLEHVRLTHVLDFAVYLVIFFGSVGWGDHLTISIFLLEHSFVLKSYGVGWCLPIRFYCQPQSLWNWGCFGFGNGIWPRGTGIGTRA